MSFSERRRNSVFRFCKKKSNILPCVVWARDSKTGLGIKIGPRQQKLWHGSQCLTDEQSSCSPVAFIPAKVHLGDLGSISMFHDILGLHRSTRVTARSGMADTIHGQGARWTGEMSRTPNWRTNQWSSNRPLSIIKDSNPSQWVHPRWDRAFADCLLALPLALRTLTVLHCCFLTTVFSVVLATCVGLIGW